MEKKAWVVAVDMGYGHQRAAYPLKDMAYGDIINANSDKMISGQEKKIEAFIELMRPFGILEVVRTGRIAMVRGSNTVKDEGRRQNEE